jgi:hypothetical protein
MTGRLPEKGPFQWIQRRGPYHRFFDEVDPRLGTTIQTFKDRNTLLRDRSNFVVVRIWRLVQSSSVRH